MTMRPRRLADMTWEEVRDLVEETAVAILPIGAIEAHGPHLPLATDGIIAEAMAQAGADRLARRGIGSLLLPTFPYTAAPFAADFPGTLSIAAETTTALVRNVAGEVARLGVPLVIANVHLDPTHLAALNAAVASVERDPKVRIVFPDITKKPWALRLTEEFQSGACHAGQYESSVILARCPELVRNEIRRSLVANPASLSEAIRDGKQTFHDAGGPRAYFGSPALASMDEGRQVIDILGGILEDAVLAALSNDSAG